jgi:hypothetical protein
MSKLQGSVKQLQATLTTNKERAEKWDQVKTLILNTFDKIKKEYPDLHLEINQGKTTRSVSVAFPHSPSILGNKEDNKLLMKNGASLTFIQSHNGNICMIEHEPFFFEEGQEPMYHSEPRIFTVNLSRLTTAEGAAEYIREAFASFVDEVNLWESENHSTTLLRIHGHHMNEEIQEGNGQYQREPSTRMGVRSGQGQHSHAL